MKILTDKTESYLVKFIDQTRMTQETVDVSNQVSKIIEEVRQNGDRALANFSIRFDGFAPKNIKISQTEIDRSLSNLDPELVEALKEAAENIRNFHLNQGLRAFEDRNRSGVVLGSKVTALESAGIYVPGGTAAYPSSVLMNAIPAKIAGVKRIVMVTPPQKDGIDPAVLAAAKIAGINEIYQVGGAQAIAALAYGTKTIEKVDKITGPGNIFVANAKRQVFGQTDIDMIAGPSEIGVIADQQADFQEIAAEDSF